MTGQGGEIVWLLEEPLHAVVTVVVPSLLSAVVSVTPWLLHRLDKLVCKTRICEGNSRYLTLQLTDEDCLDDAERHGGEDGRHGGHGGHGGGHSGTHHS